jgi:hypothetical protein
MNYLIIFLGVVLANWIFTMVSYDSSIRMNPVLSYPMAIFAGTLSASCWVYLVRNLPDKEQFITNMIWDIGVTIICIILPLLLYTIKLDLKTIVGVTIAVIGLIIAKT